MLSLVHVRLVSSLGLLMARHESLAADAAPVTDGANESPLMFTLLQRTLFTQEIEMC